MRRWVPELNDVSDENIHVLWLEKQNVPNYPDPVVGEKQARKFAADNIYKVRSCKGRVILIRTLRLILGDQL
ncbi:hypothetical protein AS144_03715 [Francisella endosymbiont of Amblyomma maculatum]|nr:hypothetical protein AS144_03715 [Francisella endosymbiont of Amblyomma maculatum]